MRVVAVALKANLTAIALFTITTVISNNRYFLNNTPRNPLLNLNQIKIPG